jgi:hypothetical protein
MKRKFTQEELEKILRHWADQTPGTLIAHDFLAWCREEASRDDSPFERLPLTIHTIGARFGSWAEALAAIGKLERPFQPARTRIRTSKKLEDHGPLDLSEIPVATSRAKGVQDASGPRSASFPPQL